MRYGAPDDKPKDNFQNVPVGKHIMEITDAKCALSKKGEPRIRVRMKPCSPDYAHCSSVFDDLPADGPHVATFLDPLCYAAGIKGGFDTERESEVRMAMLGRTLCVDIKHETYNGETRAKVRKYIAPEDAPKTSGTVAAPAGSYGLPPDDGDDWGGPSADPRDKPAPGPLGPEPPPLDDDSIPF